MADTIVDLSAKRAAREAHQRFLIENGYKDAPRRDPFDLPRAMVGHVADVVSIASKPVI